MFLAWGTYNKRLFLSKFDTFYRKTRVYIPAFSKNFKEHVFLENKFRWPVRAGGSIKISARSITTTFWKYFDHAQPLPSPRLARNTQFATHRWSMMSVFRPGLFEGKVAIVTGGGTGIGKAIARELLYLGSKVVIASRNEERLKRTAEELCRYVQPSSTGEVKVVPCNIRDEKQVTSSSLFPTAELLTYY